MKNQVEAYQAIQTYSDPTLTEEVLTNIREKAKQKYPTDYKMQLYTIEQQVKAYKELTS
jgi:hypothetical protein